jgi:hypothetical protein
MNRILLALAAFLGLLFPCAGISATGSQAVDDAWDNRFYGGLGSPLFLHSASDGSVLAVGSFSPFGPVSTSSSVLRWRYDSGWEAAAGPLGGQARAAAIFRGEVHVAGASLTAGGASLPGNVARWRTSEWTDLAGGLNGTVFAMTAHQDRLYVGGSLQSAGALALRNVACWDGESWSAVGEGVAFRVRAMAVYRDKLVVAGEAASPEALGGILEWNGSNWQPLAQGVAGTTAAAGIQALLPLADSLYAGGNFSQAGQQSVRNVARWDGTQWHSVGDGPRGAGVSALATIGKQLVAGAAELSVWDGTSWKAHEASELISLGNSISLASSGSNLMALGYSRNPVSGGPLTVVLVRDDGVEIQGLGSRSQGLPEINALDASSTGVVLGGAFRPNQGQLQECLARWDGRSWKSLDGGLNYGATGLRQRVRCVASSNDEIVAGGVFTFVGTNQFNHVARWDGARWLPLGDGVPSPLNAVAWLGDRIVAATESAGVIIWDGQAWHSLGVPPPLRYVALAVSGHEVFAAGTTQAETTSPPVTGAIVRWDGKEWTELARNLAPLVSCLHHDGRRLYAGGRFRAIQGVEAHGIAAWEGTHWASVGGGLTTELSPPFTEEVRAITSDGTGRLFLGGTFVHAASGATNVALIRGEAWHALGSGLAGSPVTAMAWWNGGLLVGGAFYLAGGRPSLALGLWNDPISTYEIETQAPRRVGPGETLEVRLLLRRVPNQEPQSSTVRFVLPAGSTFLSADRGGTDTAGTVTWTLDATNDPNLSLQCRLRVPTTESLLVLNSVSVETAGQARYRARPHAVAVAASATPARVRLIQPAASPLVARAPVVLEAEIDPGTATPASVEFYAGTTKIGAASAVPWRIEWNAPLAGMTLFRAVLVDTAGRTTASLPVWINLRAPPSNDDFIARIPLPLFTREPYSNGNTINVDPLGATAEADEPPHGPGIPAQRSLWWSFLPPADGRISFAFSREGIRVRLYTGSDLAHLTTVDSVSPDLTIPVQRDIPYSIAADYAQGLDATAWTYRYEAAGGRFARALALSPEMLEFLFESPETREYTLEGSTNLVDWVPVSSFVAPQGWHAVMIPRPSEPAHQFYRAR